MPPGHPLEAEGTVVLSEKPRHFKTHLAVSLEDLVPQDNLYRRLEATLDLSFVRDLVRECYAPSMGRPSIDPVVFFKLQLIIGIQRALFATLSNPSELTIGYESLDSHRQFDDNSFLKQTHYFTCRLSFDRIGLFELVPRIFLRLFQTKCNPAFITVESKHDDFDFFALLDNFSGMTHSLRPG